jgi:hypothetical protein
VYQREELGLLVETGKRQQREREREREIDR